MTDRTPNERTRHKRAQRKRQLERVRRELVDARGRPAEEIASDSFDGVVDALARISKRCGGDPDEHTRAWWLEVVTALTDARFVVKVDRVVASRVWCAECATPMEGLPVCPRCGGEVVMS